MLIGCGIIFLGDNFEQNKELLDRKGISQKDFAAFIGMNEGTLSKIINEKKEVTIPTAKKISNGLGWGIDYIWPD